MVFWGRGTESILNFPPNKTGLMEEGLSTLAKEVGVEIKRRYGGPSLGHTVSNVPVNGVLQALLKCGLFELEKLGNSKVKQMS